MDILALQQESLKIAGRALHKLGEAHHPPQKDVPSESSQIELPLDLWELLRMPELADLPLPPQPSWRTALAR